MSTRSERIEARLTPEERRQIEQAARLESRSLSAFLVSAALARADEVLAEHVVTTVPPEYFDRLTAALDEPDDAPRLQQVAGRTRPSRIG